MDTKKLLDDFYWVGNLDPDLRIFDIVMETEFGTTYNSYILVGSEKVALFEAAKLKCYDEYIEKIKSIVPLEKIDYLIVNHTEPDHTGTIEKMLEIMPNLKIYGSMGALNFLNEITNKKIEGVAVKDGDELSLGNYTLEFISAPNLHWPDSIFTYVKENKVLLTCDAFGSHYSDTNITDENLKNYDDYLKALEYYFVNIIGPFKGDMINAIDKIKDKEIDILAVGHGPVVVKHVQETINRYKELATDKSPFTKKTVVIPYVTSYGYTKTLAEELKKAIEAQGFDALLFDMIYADFGEVMSKIYFADGVLLGTPTIAGEALPNIWNIAISLNKHVHKNKLISSFGSFGWSGEGVPNIMARLNAIGSLRVFEEGFRCRFKPSELQLKEIYDFGKRFCGEIS